MLKPIFASKQHETVILKYLNIVLDFIEDCSPETKYKNYLEILDIIIQYHNEYGTGIKQGNWNDYLMIIPINVSIMTNGFLVGLENRNNKTKIKSYKYLLNEQLDELIEDIEKIKPSFE